MPGWEPFFGNDIDTNYKTPNAGGYIRGHANGSYLNFTGQHKLYSTNNSLYDSKYVGFIVSSKGQYKNINNKTRGNLNNIKINESLPNVELSSIKNDKKVIGVISNIEDENENTRTYTVGVWGSLASKEDNDNRLEVNSLGEGAIWVSDIYGPLNGDYITSLKSQALVSKMMIFCIIHRRKNNNGLYSCNGPMTEFGDSDSSYNYIRSVGNIQYEPDYLMKLILVEQLLQKKNTQHEKKIPNRIQMAFVGCHTIVVNNSRIPAARCAKRNMQTIYINGEKIKLYSK